MPNAESRAGDRRWPVTGCAADLGAPSASQLVIQVLDEGHMTVEVYLETSVSEDEGTLVRTHRETSQCIGGRPEGRANGVI